MPFFRDWVLPFLVAGTLSAVIANVASGSPDARTLAAMIWASPVTLAVALYFVQLKSGAESGHVVDTAYKSCVMLLPLMLFALLVVVLQTHSVASLNGSLAIAFVVWLVVTVPLYLALRD